MYAEKNQTTPSHTHQSKKEDIICRAGNLAIQAWKGHPNQSTTDIFQLKVNGEKEPFTSGDIIKLDSGERVTLSAGIYHEFYPFSDQCIIGEVSTANDDVNDNFFVNEKVGRFYEIEEDEPALLKLVSD